MKKTFLKITIAFIAIIAQNSDAQEYTFKDYNWDDKAITAEIPEKYKNENEVILDRHIKVEVASNGKEVYQYYLVHKKKLINSDDAIERNNRIYIPFGANESVIDTKARVILKSGKIITLDKKDIKEETDEEKGVKYNFFALTGVEKGAIIEQIFVLQENPELDGYTIKMQEEYPVINSSLEVIHPSFVGFKSKSYNGLSEPVIDEKKYTEKVSLLITEKEVPALHDDEKYSNWDANIRSFRYKLYENYNTGAKNIYNFKKFATNIYDRFNADLEKKDQKVIDDFCKTIPTSNDLQEQVWNIENKIKKSISYDKYFDSKESLADVVKSKQFSQSDMLRFYLAVFKKMNVEVQPVFTSNRYKLIFDGDFESYENLNELLFYFPGINKFLCPSEVEYRIPLFPDVLGNQNGLFLKTKEFGGVKMGIGEVKFIDIPGIEVTHDVMDITVDFTKDLENPTISSKMSYGGYSAMNFQPIKDYVDANQYKDILKNVSENYSGVKEYKKLTTENDGLDNIGKKPFILNLEFEGKELVQKAGENYLFSVGKIIGTQMELYQEDKRTLPVEIDNPHSYLRTIKIILPDGVTVKNLDKFNMNHTLNVNGKPEAVFISSYKATKNEITIENTEYYKIVNYPLDRFEEYKTVINAAADFNKIVIILTKG